VSVTRERAAPHGHLTHERSHVNYAKW